MLRSWWDFLGEGGKRTGAKCSAAIGDDVCWGLPTAECITIRAAQPEVPLIASGGLRHGLDVEGNRTGSRYCWSGPFCKPQLNQAALTP